MTNCRYVSGRGAGELLTNNLRELEKDLRESENNPAGICQLQVKSLHLQRDQALLACTHLSLRAGKPFLLGGQVPFFRVPTNLRQLFYWVVVIKHGHAPMGDATSV